MTDSLGGCLCPHLVARAYTWLLVPILGCSCPHGGVADPAALLLCCRPHGPFAGLAFLFVTRLGRHCRKLAPVYASVAAKFADDEDIVIAQIDGSANDIPGMVPEGFPTLIFFPKVRHIGSMLRSPSGLG